MDVGNTTFLDRGWIERSRVVKGCGDTYLLKAAMV